MKKTLLYLLSFVIVVVATMFVLKAFTLLFEKLVYIYN